MAAEYASAKIFAELLVMGANPDAINSDKSTPLILAAFYGYTQLIDSGADVNAADNEGNNAWNLAKNDEIRDALEKAGADVPLWKQLFN